MDNYEKIRQASLELIEASREISAKYNLETFDVVCMYEDFSATSLALLSKYMTFDDKHKHMDELLDALRKDVHERMVEYDIYLYDIPSFVATHLVRHHVCCEKFVVTNREDRRNINPEEVNRLTPVDMMMTCNAQPLINISRKRLCTCASKETRDVWQAVKNAIAEIDPVMARMMCRECIYRGLCPEMSPCGFVYSKKYEEELAEYLKGKKL